MKAALQEASEKIQRKKNKNEPRRNSKEGKEKRKQPRDILEGENNKRV